MIGIALGLIVFYGDHREIDGEDAVNIATRFARSMGFHERLDIASLNQADSKQWRIGSGKLEQVQLVLPDGRFMQIFVSMKGEIELFQLIQAPGHTLQSNQTLPPGTDVSAMARRLLKFAHPTGEYELRPFDKGAWGPFRSAFFDVTIEAHRFFNLNPTYAYNINFDGRNGQVNWFSRPPSIPPVAATKPVISSAKAVALLEHWARTHYLRQRGNSSMFAPDSPWNPTTVAELGYYKFEHESKARLVYRGQVWTHIKGLPSTESGWIRMYADAITGELIAPDDPGIG